MKVTTAILVFSLVLAGCSNVSPSPSPTTGPTPAPATELTLLTHDSFAVSDEVLAAFEARTGATVKILRAGDAGSMVNQAILTKDNPIADVLFGVDNTFLSRALDAGIFEPYGAAGLEQVPAELRLDARQRVTPIDYGDVCINYDKDAYGPGTTPPQTLEDLVKPAYHGQLVVEDPATSSPGLAFMLATIAHFGEQGDYTWRDYWRELRDNDVLVVSGWEEAYYGAFSGGAGEGDRPIVVSYATSPAAEVYFADPAPAQPPTASLTEGCFRQVEFAGVLAGTDKADLAGGLIDFMISPEFQADIPLNMFVFPALPTAPLPQVFVAHAAHIAEPLTMAPDLIGANRERWLSEWNTP
jgi:thiamine transport system substrate-binding protein